jgi:hypothetical protein
MQHYARFIHRIVSATTSLIDGRQDKERMFTQLSFDRWLRQQKIKLLHCDAHFVPGDLRKFLEQMGDILELDQSNKNYLLAHDVSGVDRSHYKHPLPENVDDI